MSWFQYSANETEAAKKHVLMFKAVAFDFPSGFLRVWTGVGDLTFGGNTYTGVGDLGRIGEAEERNNLTVERKTYQLMAVDPALVAESDINGCAGRDVIEYFGFLDTDARTLVTTPEICWKGKLDSISRVDGSNPYIEVSAEQELVLLDQADGWLFTEQHQQQFAAGDHGFDQVLPSATKTLLWGGAFVKTGNGFGAGSGAGGREEMTVGP